MCVPTVIEAFSFQREVESSIVVGPVPTQSFGKNLQEEGKYIEGDDTIAFLS